VKRVEYGLLVVKDLGEAGLQALHSLEGGLDPREAPGLASLQPAESTAHRTEPFTQAPQPEQN